MNLTHVRSVVKYVVPLKSFTHTLEVPMEKDMMQNVELITSGQEPVLDIRITVPTAKLSLHRKWP